MARHATAAEGTSARILDAAERLVQTRGFNGFSYADVAAELGLTTAALHYHFPGKAELGAALVDRYAQRFAAQLGELDAAGGPAPGRLDGFAALYLQVLQDRRMCLCGMLAAEYHTLPEGMQELVLRFFSQNESWLETVLAQGAREGALQYAGSASDAARLLISGLEGAMLIARSFGDPGRFTAAASRLLASVTGAADAVGSDGAADTGSPVSGDGVTGDAKSRPVRTVPPDPVRTL
ncbi:MAG TPA: TetR/AcrR family transcriptional regulator [Streptosporangiaceae bacterium]